MAEAQSESMAELAGKYMTFRLEREEYGLGILNVREIIRLLEITRVPRSRNYLRGVINLRGKVIPVVDLRVKFAMPPTEPTEQSVIIVVQYEAANHQVVMGVLVDEVLEVMSIQSDQIEPPPLVFSRSEDSDFILGVGKADKRVIFLLDIARVLSVDQSIEMRSLIGKP